MRILLVGPVPPELGSKNHGGVARHVWDLAQALHRRGHDVELLALGRYYRTTRRVDDIVVHGLTPRTLWQFPRLLHRWVGFVKKSDQVWGWRDYMYVLYAFVRLSTVINESFDIVHAHGYGHKVPVACSLLDAAIPVTLTVHSYHSVQFGSSDQRQKVRKYDYINTNVDGLIHVSHADRRKGKEFGVDWGCPDFVVHNAVSIGKENLPGAGRNGICFVGSLIRRKGLDILVEAWRECQNVEEMRIIGEGPLSEDIEAQVEYKSSIKMLGYLEKKEALWHMRRANALVVPSRSESFGLVYLEALLMGTPIVGYHRTLNEFISVLSPTEEELDYIYPYDAGRESIASLAEVIEKAVAARHRDKEGQVARGLIRKVRRHFGWDHIVPKIENIYKHVCNSKMLINKE